MASQLQSPDKSDTIYPENNGEPMSNNTERLRLIVEIKENLELMFAKDPNVFIADDLLWYPVEGNNKLCKAPDVMVVFGIPKGYRGSYQQWLENDIAPQVAFDIWSPGDSLIPILEKFKFYESYGVEEFYLYDPQTLELSGWFGIEGQLELIEQMDGWVSPRLGVCFQLSEAGLEMFVPTGEPSLSFVELARLREEAQMRAEQAEMMLEQERSRSQALESKLREMGIDPNQL